MNVFQYLKEDDAAIEGRLQNITEHYEHWTPDHVFEETKKVLNSIRVHFDVKESLLANNLKAKEGMECSLEECEKERQEIYDEIDNIVQIHVDEDGFYSGLKKLLSKVTEHRKFCNDIYYPNMRARLTDSDLVHIQQQLDQMVLS